MHNEPCVSCHYFIHIFLNNSIGALIHRCVSVLAAIGSELIVDPIVAPGECLQMGGVLNPRCPLISIPSFFVQVPLYNSCPGAAPAFFGTVLERKKTKKTDVQFLLPLGPLLHIWALCRVRELLSPSFTCDAYCSVQVVESEQ